jgi:hypothetical protein
MLLAGLPPSWQGPLLVFIFFVLIPALAAPQVQRALPIHRRVVEADPDIALVVVHTTLDAGVLRRRHAKLTGFCAIPQAVGRTGCLTALHKKLSAIFSASDGPVAAFVFDNDIAEPAGRCKVLPAHTRLKF